MKRRARGTLLAAAVSFVATVGPLLLYIAFGPADGNPIGLGLLAALGVPLSVVLLLVGLVWLAVEAAQSRGKTR
jgi:hypothetical protein